MTDSSPPPDREEQIRQIMTYLEQHREQYDLIALRKQLLANGYPNTLVDEALRRLDGGKTSAGVPRVRLIGFGLAFGNYVVLALLFAVLSGLRVSNGYLLLIVPAVLLGAELVVAGATWNSERRRGLGRAMLWAVIWTLAAAAILVAFIALLFGICLAIFGSQL